MENEVDNEFNIRKIRKQKIIIIVGIFLLLGLLTIGGTYAYLQFSATITNGNYNSSTTCFNIVYDTANGDGTSAIAGTLFPSSGPMGGLFGKVSLKVDPNCNVNGIGNLYLDISSASDTLLQEVTKGRCEDRETLMTLTNYTNSSDCTRHTRVKWITTGTALKYAVYKASDIEDNSTDQVPVPLKVGYVDSTGSIPLYSDFNITSTPSSYYIYIWLDGNISDNTYTNMTFDGKIRASATQDELLILTLSKETYIEDDFSDWELGNGATLDNGVLTFNQISYEATSKCIAVNGGYWYAAFDGYAEAVCDQYASIGKGGIYWNSYYYDSDYNKSTTPDGYSGNGWAVRVSLNSWSEGLNWLGNPETYRRYGPNIKYVKLKFTNSDAGYSSPPPIRIRNMKIYGEAILNNFYLINIVSNKKGKIVSTKYAKGEQTLDYFNENGIDVTNNQIEVYENGVYTVYIRDNRGNTAIEKIEITNIGTPLPNSECTPK